MKKLKVLLKASCAFFSGLISGAPKGTGSKYKLWASPYKSGVEMGAKRESIRVPWKVFRISYKQSHWRHINPSFSYRWALFSRSMEGGQRRKESGKTWEKHHKAAPWGIEMSNWKSKQAGWKKSRNGLPAFLSLKKERKNVIQCTYFSCLTLLWRFYPNITDPYLIGGDFFFFLLKFLFLKVCSIKTHKV